MKEKFTEKGTLVDIKLRELVKQTEQSDVIISPKSKHISLARLGSKMGLQLTDC